MVTAREVAAALARLREAAPMLRARSAETVVDALAQALEGWRDAGSPWRRALEARLPERAGFSPEVVREGLALGLAAWTGDALRALVARELPEDAAHHASGFPTTALVCAGAIPMPALLGILAPLALRSAVLVKPSAHDPVTPELVARSLAAVDPLLGACVEVTPFPSADDDALGAFVQADCVVATGSDEAVAAIARRVPTPRRFVAYGHRLSLALLGPGAWDGAPLAEAARALALDAALWDQLGCLSPVSVHVVGGGRAEAARVAEALAEALAATGSRLPRGRVELAAAAAAARERAEAEMRAAAGRAVRVFGGAPAPWTVVLEEDAAPRPSPLHRFLRVHPVADDARLVSALAPLAAHLAAVAVAGFGAETPRVARVLAELGVSRVCRPGRLQTPPLGWHHDNQGVLLPLARFADVELA
jgi:hypothetical protein